jgi:hypothetical protein
MQMLMLVLSRWTTMEVGWLCGGGSGGNDDDSVWCSLEWTLLFCWLELKANMELGNSKSASLEPTG